MGRLFACIAFLVLSFLAISASAADGGKRYALIIGINDYELLGKLECAREDAEALADVLVQNCGFDPARLCLIATINGKPAAEFWKEFAAANPGK